LAKGKPHKSTSRDLALSDLQLALMRVFWSRPTATVAEVATQLRGTRPLAHTTVATLLTRLEKRGLLTATREGRQVSYSAAVPEHEVRRSMVSSLLTGLFDGNASGLLSHLVDQRRIGAGELAEIRAALARKGRS
jgi:BlaI family transcriptional regulator, penicillinase repressor